MQLAALVGCAVPTGAGVVFNTARPRPGQSIAVFGVGGIGSCAVAAAALCGCHPVIAVDVNADKLALAQTLGATHCVNPKRGDPVQEIHTLCQGGTDFAIEATGNPAVMLQSLACVRPQGGAAVIVGNARHGQMLEIDPRELNQGKRLLGTWGGDNVPDRDYPRYGKLIREGKLNVEPLLGRTYGLHDINAALYDLEHGLCARPLIDMSL
jgi:S-(hydroxymethyl)glutathione dehydrogenase/alcohol dehydrogenase